MATTLTPVSQYDGDITVPENGDDLDADVIAAAFQVAADRAALAKDAGLGTLRWFHAMVVTAGGSPTSFVVSLGAIASCVIECGDGVVRSLTSAGASVTQAAIEGGGGSLGYSSQWWYVYAYADTTTLAFEISTTAPTADLTWKLGSVGTKRYLGCFRTTGAGVPTAVRMHRGRYWYRSTELGATDLRVLSGGSATSYTDVDLTGFVPTHARMSELGMILVPNTAVSTAIGGAVLRKNGTAGAGVIALDCGTGAQWPYANRTVWLETDVSRLIEYRVSTSTGSDYPALSLDVLGFQE